MGSAVDTTHRIRMYTGTTKAYENRAESAVSRFCHFQTNRIEDLGIQASRSKSAVVIELSRGRNIRC